MKNRSKKPLIALVLLLLVGVVGVTLAYFTSSATFENIFQTKPYSTVFTEEFVSPTDWTPGTETDKKVFAKNTGDVDVAVRVSYTEKWVSADGTELPLTFATPEQDVAIVNLTNTADWIEVGDYYYYNKILAKDEETSTFINSVTFNPNVVNSLTLDETTGECQTVEENGKTTVTCTSKGDGYDGATYTLTITVETVQADAVEDFWNVTIENDTVTEVSSGTGESEDENA